MRLDLSGVSVRLDGRPIVHEADLVVDDGEFVALVGPNGCGKSTLMRTIYRALRPSAGLITVDGDDVHRLSWRESARRTAVVAQETPAELDFTVGEVVLMGRTPYERAAAADEERCARALDRVGLGGGEERGYATLSGGEKQRALIARALVQETRLLLLDEPTSHLDIRHQLEILHLVRELGVATLAVLHDLNQAAAFCDRLYVMSAGRVLAGGPPEQVLTPELISQVYGVRAVRRTQLVFERLAL
ncbi:ABC transporter (iron.B12.siderophore.hemin), ATP-binding component [[Actinomadura] parvosata subsp. kistnae]|uniref:Histidinol phosphatase n=1 Tax=[Actinomadura] parvosata subsp. kistnae TaxID=1909395 RepID=A0A1U9ZTW2_9ACTN|nr:ABC transporter ATP-binding protein [Nonomuraea sp. ATCC 55076]AQZ61359.1 histidinol phosphatase [Nonomuraea sp. ATCC 55076]SPL98026.1 ABC transporter (iron.B12.siderophore.hemin), ATP-binding component [Actinomadura parvosata subsp. kistnae]